MYKKKPQFGHHNKSVQANSYLTYKADDLVN